MLTDPENPSERWEHDIWADNLDEARSICERIAARYRLIEVESVTQETRNPSRYGGYKFTCWFKAEVENNVSDGD